MPIHDRRDRPLTRRREARPPLTSRQKAIMLGGLLRREEIFNSVYGKLFPSHFGDNEIVYRAIWEATCVFWEAHRMLPTKLELQATIEVLIEQDRSLVNSRGEVAEIGELIDSIFRRKASSFRKEFVLTLIQQFMEDCLAAEARVGLAHDANTPLRLLDLLSGLTEQAEVITGIKTGDVEEPFPDDWRPAAIGKTPTGVSFIDMFLNGGDAKGEVYGLLGPYGSCKTALAIKLSIEKAKAARSDWLRSGKKSLGLVYYFSYEAPKEELRIRSLVYAARVDKTTLEDNDDWSKLSNRSSLREYERKMFADVIAERLPVDGEQERLAAAKKLLNRNWRFLDMTGGDSDNPARGTGLASEIQAIIRASMEKNPGCHVAGVFIDYAKAAVEKHMGYKEIDRRDLRHYLGAFPFQIKTKVAIPFDCPVWILHQLTGAANARSATKVQHHTDSSEAKNFAENLDFCFQVGTLTHDKLALFACTKHRRSAPVRETVIKVIGELGDVVHADDYMPDPLSHTFVKKSDYDRIAVERQERRENQQRSVSRSFDSTMAVSDGYGGL